MQLFSVLQIRIDLSARCCPIVAWQCFPASQCFFSLLLTTRKEGYAKDVMTRSPGLASGLGARPLTPSPGNPAPARYIKREMKSADSSPALGPIISRRVPPVIPMSCGQQEAHLPPGLQVKPPSSSSDGVGEESQRCLDPSPLYRGDHRSLASMCVRYAGLKAGCFVYLAGIGSRTCNRLSTKSKRSREDPWLAAL